MTGHQDWLLNACTAVFRGCKLKEASKEAAKIGRSVDSDLLVDGGNGLICLHQQLRSTEQTYCLETNHDSLVKRPTVEPMQASGTDTGKRCDVRRL